MNAGRREGRAETGHLPMATLVRSVPVRLVEVSRGGCRIETDSRFETGTAGLLAVPIAGLLRIDDVRVARCQQRAGAGDAYNLGAELLRTRRLGRRSLRAAVTRIIGDGRGVGHAQAGEEEPLPVVVRTDGASGKFESRAPPAHSDNGP